MTISKGRSGQFFALLAVMLLAQTSAAQSNIALHRPISAVGAEAGQPAIFANDGDSATTWIHDQTTGWITVDLGSPSTVSTIRLLVEQAPAGLTQHVVSVAGEDQVFSPAHTFSQITQSNTWLIHSFSPAKLDVRYVMITTTLSPSWLAWRELEVLGQTAEATNCHACYFGYYWGAGEHPGMTGNYMSEFSDHSNIVHIVDADHTRLVAKLAEARQRGMMAILAPQGQLFAAKGTLHTDYQARLTAYANAVKPYIDDVLAIYPVDEPLWWGNACHHDTATRQVYETANAAIKASFPGKPIIATFAFPCVTASLTIPDGYDWISFDQYGTFAPIPGYLSIIKSKLSGGQKIILTADGFVAGGVPSVEAQYSWVERARQYRNMALTDPQVIGLWTFIWPSFTEGAGVRDLPPIKEEYRWIGQQLSSCKPPGAQACCVRAHCDDNDANTRDSCNVITRQCVHSSTMVDAGVSTKDAAAPTDTVSANEDGGPAGDAPPQAGDAPAQRGDGRSADSRALADANSPPPGELGSPQTQVTSGCNCTINGQHTGGSALLLLVFLIALRKRRQP